MADIVERLRAKFRKTRYTREFHVAPGEFQAMLDEYDRLRHALRNLMAICGDRDPEVIEARKLLEGRKDG